jgi:hypothetical protein
VDRLSQSSREGTGPHGDDKLVDELAGAGTDDVGAEQLSAPRMTEERLAPRDQLDETAWLALDDRAIDRRVGEERGADVALPRPGLRLGEPDVGDLRVGEGHPRATR